MTDGARSSPGLANRLALTFGRARLVGDAVDALIAGFLGDEVEAELLAYNARKEAAHRVLLPARHLHDGRNGSPTAALEHGNHRSLLRLRPAGLRLHLSRHARFSGGAEAPARRPGFTWLPGRPRRFSRGGCLCRIGGPDRRETKRGYAQGECTLIVV